MAAIREPVRLFRGRGRSADSGAPRPPRRAETPCPRSLRACPSAASARSSGARRVADRLTAIGAGQHRDAELARRARNRRSSRCGPRSATSSTDVSSASSVPTRSSAASTGPMRADPVGQPVAVRDGLGAVLAQLIVPRGARGGDHRAPRGRPRAAPPSARRRRWRRGSARCRPSPPGVRQQVPRGLRRPAAAPPPARSSASRACVPRRRPSTSTRSA